MLLSSVLEKYWKMNNRCVEFSFLLFCLTAALISNVASAPTNNTSALQTPKISNATSSGLVLGGQEFYKVDLQVMVYIVFYNFWCILWTKIIMHCDCNRSAGLLPDKYAWIQGCALFKLTQKRSNTLSRLFWVSSRLITTPGLHFQTNVWRAHGAGRMGPCSRMTTGARLWIRRRKTVL